MERIERFSINALIEKNAQGSTDEHGEENGSDVDEESAAQEMRHAVTSFSVRDILDPQKFNTQRRPSSGSDSDQENPERDPGGSPHTTNPWRRSWTDATRSNCPLKAHGELLNLSRLAPCRSRNLSELESVSGRVIFTRQRLVFGAFFGSISHTARMREAGRRRDSTRFLF